MNKITIDVKDTRKLQFLKELLGEFDWLDFKVGYEEGYNFINLPKDISQRIEEDFKPLEARAVKTIMLGIFAQRERGFRSYDSATIICRCVLYIARGNLSRLMKCVVNEVADYRNLLGSAASLGNIPAAMLSVPFNEVDVVFEKLYGGIEPPAEIWEEE